ncbi:hypothetical protein MW887_003427 [Aspergillus wentii]|nr:hypothetical protein MW887_003427 [Aspergillus wentii]
MEKTVNIDLVVIGAGWFGLAAAKAYIDINPLHNVVILDSAPSVGGVWATYRLYKGLATNNIVGSFEYSDFPMDERFGVRPGHHISGDSINQYLEAYVDEFGLRSRIQCDSKVETATHSPDESWVLHITQSGSSRCLHARKMIVATGLNAEPIMPTFAGQEEFQTPLFHCRDLAENESMYLKSERPVTVLGCNKSSWDTVNACAASGQQVDWIIRASGHGPILMASPYFTPWKVKLERMPSTRLVSWFSPCIWGDGRLPRFLHRTWLGRKVVSAFWKGMDKCIHPVEQYNAHPEMQKLMPWGDAPSFSVWNYPTDDLVDAVRNGTVRIHIANITHLSSQTVHLSTGESLPSAALICSTGWKPCPPIKFLPEGIETELGLPSGNDIDEQIIDAANKHILGRLPRLKKERHDNLPNYKPMTDQEPDHPYRLARFMVPPSMVSERSVVFVGAIHTFHTGLVSQAQGLWAAAYLSDRLTITPSSKLPASLRSGKQGDAASREEDVLWETALHSQFCRLRHPGPLGKWHGNVGFDLLPYLDLLLKDLGLQGRRRSGVKEMLGSYSAGDYRGLTREWRERQRMGVDG